jgi:hypothetical protein
VDMRDLKELYTTEAGSSQRQGPRYATMGSIYTSSLHSRPRNDHLHHILGKKTFLLRTEDRITIYAQKTSAIKSLHPNTELRL